MTCDKSAVTRFDMNGNAIARGALAESVHKYKCTLDMSVFRWVLFEGSVLMLPEPTPDGQAERGCPQTPGRLIGSVVSLNILVYNPRIINKANFIAPLPTHF